MMQIASAERPHHPDRAIEQSIVELIPALRAYAWSLTRNPQDVDDLVQDTLLKAIAKANSFQPGTNLRAWLITIMRNSFYNQIKKSARMRTGASDCVSVGVSAPPTQEWAVRGGELMHAIMQLPQSYREMLVLVVMLGESYEGAARICGVAIGTVKSRVNRSRAMVIEILERDNGHRPSSRRKGGENGFR